MGNSGGRMLPRPFAEMNREYQSRVAKIADEYFDNMQTWRDVGPPRSQTVPPPFADPYEYVRCACDHKTPNVVCTQLALAQWKKLCAIVVWQDDDRRMTFAASVHPSGKIMNDVHFATPPPGIKFGGNGAAHVGLLSLKYMPGSYLWGDTLGGIRFDRPSVNS